MKRKLKSSPQRSSHLLLSYFDGTSDAELALADLVAEGISEQDFTLVKIGAKGSDGFVDALENVIEDFGNKRIPPQNQLEGVSDRESRIGGGIETSTPDDDVSEASEMDDSESVIEETLYPVTGHSIGMEQAYDVGNAAEKGFFDTIDPEKTETRKAENILTEFTLPAVGVVIGEGSFGERLTEAVFTVGPIGIESLIAQIDGKLDPSELHFHNRGGILAVDAESTGPSEERIADILRNRGASFVELL